MVEVSLCCAIVGKAGGVFGVKIDNGVQVWELQDAIKAKKPNDFKDIDADKLQLFLAKTEGGAWLTDDDQAALDLEDGKVHEDIQALIDGEKMKATKTLQHWLFEKNKMPQPSTDQIHVLVVVPRGAPAPENKRKRKRMEDEDAPDAWINAIKDERVTALPSTCEVVKDHLQRALHVKIPVNDRLFQIMSTRNSTGEVSSVLDKLFEPEPRETISDITAAVLREIIDPLGSGSESATEDTYHHLRDSVIAILLRLVTDGNFRRNTNVSASTGAYRPDLCFYSINSNVCVFRGEEKASGELDVPVKELYKTNMET
ncbi:unnamed protein product [Phytophthora lilii]|uniref:Unnamed protein product n=1 Tax=Phytophthora lilii TaxID=2077276 RepID=A0A9W6YJV0_9STRA|nr:unnamed protein product [Phytophthora lilii]